VALSLEGLDTKLSGRTISASLQETHPLVALRNPLPWSQLAGPVIADLKKTTAKGYWWLGRKLHVRIHLAAYFLQKIYDFDRTPDRIWIRDNAAFQLLCGRESIENWHAPDQTKNQC
jgi:IS5 family transposase